MGWTWVLLLLGLLQLITSAATLLAFRRRYGRLPALTYGKHGAAKPVAVGLAAVAWVLVVRKMYMVSF